MIMKHAYVFPGQGAQAPGMGKDLYDNVPLAKEMFEKANEILGFRITDIMFEGTAEELKQTKVTQPAVFLHSVILAKSLGVNPDAVAGHSLGEFSALVVAGALSFEDGLRLVSKRALAMQKCCEMQPGGMAAVLGLADDVVEKECAAVDGVVVGANYNCPWAELSTRRLWSRHVRSSKRLSPRLRSPHRHAPYTRMSTRNPIPIPQP